MQATTTTNSARVLRSLSWLGNTWREAIVPRGFVFAPLPAALSPTAPVNTTEKKERHKHVTETRELSTVAAKPVGTYSTTAVRHAPCGIQHIHKSIAAGLWGNENRNHATKHLVSIS